MVRLVAPVLGASVDAWTQSVAVVLAASALGCFRAGRIRFAAAPFDLVSRIRGIMCWAGVLAAIAAVLTIPVASLLLPPPSAMNPFMARPHNFRTSLIVGGLLFGPVHYLLGHVSPWLVRVALNSGVSAGKATGSVLCWSTCGGVLGLFLSHFVLVPGLGSRATIVSVGALLAIPWFWQESHAGRHLRWLRLALPLVCASIACGLLPKSPRLGSEIPDLREVRVTLEAESRVQFVRVALFERTVSGGPPKRELRLSLDEGLSEYHSLLVEGEILTGGYYDLLCVTPALFDREGLDLIVLGGGAGTLPRLVRKTWGAKAGSITNVEIDRRVSDLGPDFGWRPNSPDRDLVADARDVILRTKTRFDVIILDAYAQQIAIPPHLATVEFFQLCALRMETDAVLVINTSVPSFEAPLAQALLRTLREVFPSVAFTTVPETWNLLLLASPKPGRSFVPAACPDILKEPCLQFVKGLYSDPKPNPGSMLLRDECAPMEWLARQPK